MKARAIKKIGEMWKILERDRKWDSVSKKRDTAAKGRKHWVQLSRADEEEGGCNQPGHEKQANGLALLRGSAGEDDLEIPLAGFGPHTGQKATSSVLAALGQKFEK